MLQLDGGFELDDNPDSVIPGNLLILSQGGKGHVPVPLLLGERETVVPLASRNKVVFCGTARPKRNEIIGSWRRLMGRQLTVTGVEKNWTDSYRAHDFILCPRGYGRCSFRAYEVIQMGLAPIICFRRRRWLPYLNSSFDWDKMAFNDILSATTGTVRRVLGTSRSRLDSMRRHSVKYRHTHFTLMAVAEQIRWFMAAGTDFSDLRCDRYYVEV